MATGAIDRKIGGSGDAASVALPALRTGPAISAAPSLEAAPTATAGAVAPAKLSPVAAIPVFVFLAPVDHSPALAKSLFPDFGSFTLRRR